jgi:VanZ family protein
MREMIKYKMSNYKIIYWIPVILLIALIFKLSSQPAAESGKLSTGITVINALRRSGIRGYKCVVYALLICIIYAASDEMHQSYVPGRGAQVKDVIISI